MISDVSLPEKGIELEVDKVEDYVLKYLRINRNIHRMDEDVVRSYQSNPTVILGKLYL